MPADASQQPRSSTAPLFHLPLLHLDDEVAAVDKPPGLLVHPSALDAHEAVTALGLLRVQLGQPLWPLHRLDKATSGVLVFARSAEAARTWRGAFERGEVRKRYVALARGWTPEEGTIEHPLARDPELPSAGQPRLPALTRYRRTACIEWPFATDPRHETTRASLVEAMPDTGRRHQIRRHFKQIAHPLVGDSTHGKGSLNRAVAAWTGVARMWLHASEMDLGGRRLRAPLGREWLLLDPSSDYLADAARGA